MIEKFKGVGVALVTPFTEQGTVDVGAFNRLVDYTTRGGVDYLVIHGTTGEAATTTEKEKAEFLELLFQANIKKLPVVYGLGGNNTAALINEVQQLNLEGVDALLSAGPAYSLPTQEGIFQHYTALADASPKPLILYNVPARTARNISAETTLRLAEHENIIGIKEASKDLNQCMEIARHQSESFLLISGDDMLTIPMISIGGAGVISVLANALPDIFCKMVTNALNGKYEEAQQALFKVLELNSLLYCEGNPVGVKQVLKELNICEPYVRLPLVKASNSLGADLKQALQKLS
ncbi:4-hydroxy-tetrahydrodipicolinate synthase [Nafulsella turpanensis]|uniref:4-hydroxy-tetrahydrodipicolinate synthase n=1 Tax=Nafulsella turpanensis TaxID=1265690 RepID=UPI00034BEC99|nr:4-hydroxy-tetrahydrodipicolinate synthase [Nafulsella turpanensis]